MRDTRESDSFEEELNWRWAHFIGIVIPRPPSWAGNANNSLSLSLKLCLPIKAGKNTSDCIFEWLWQTVNVWYGMHDVVPAAHQAVSELKHYIDACGWNSAITDKFSTSFTQSATLSHTKSSTSALAPTTTPRYLFPLSVTLMPVSLNNSFAASRCSDLTTSHVLDGFG